MTDQPSAGRPASQGSIPFVPDSRRRDAAAALEAVLATVEQRRSVLSQWESFHFRRGLNALLAGDYKKAWNGAEDALTPLAERTASAKTRMKAAGPLDQCSIVVLRKELADARGEPSKS